MRKRFHLLLAFCPGLLLFLFSNLQAQIYTGHLALTTQAEVDAFNYTGVTGGLTIDDMVDGNITNINGLTNLTFTGGLYISDNPALTDLDGLSNLTSVGHVVNGHLVIQNNDALTGMEGMSKLSYIGYDLIITGNDALSNMNGLSNVGSIGGQLFIQFNRSLANLDGLSGVVSIGTSAVISANTSLANINGLSNLTTIGGYLSLSGNNSLTNVDGLSSLISIGNDLELNGNNTLTNLDGLSDLSSVGGDLEINNNAVLDQFCGLHTLLSPDPVNNGLSGNYSVVNNKANPTEPGIISNGPCNVLPVQFTLFNTKCSGSEILINWKTAWEQNSSHFIVKRSLDGINWTNIASQPAAGSSNTERSYSITDHNPVERSYYRIAQYDTDGRVHYTKILGTPCNLVNVFKVWPNPFVDDVFANISAEGTSQATIKVLDSKGVFVKIQRISLLPGNNQVKIDMSILANGIYQLIIEGDDGQVRKTTRVVKQ